jgi:hypothetical protein
MNEEFLAKLIGQSVGLYPNEIATLLNQNGVTIDAENFDTNQLIDAVFNGLRKNVSFNSAFSVWVDKNQDKLNL